MKMVSSTEDKVSNQPLDMGTAYWQIRMTMKFMQDIGIRTNMKGRDALITYNRRPLMVQSIGTICKPSRMDGLIMKVLNI